MILGIYVTLSTLVFIVLAALAGFYFYLLWPEMSGPDDFGIGASMLTVTGLVFVGFASMAALGLASMFWR